MPSTQNHKNLIVWQKSRLLAVAVYRNTSRFPRNERFGLASQMRRAAVSVVSNIAEGAGRGSQAEFRHFLYIARGSLAELETHFLLAGDLEFHKSGTELADVAEVGRLLNGLIASLLSSD